MIDLSDDDDNDAVASSQAFEDEVRAPIAPIQGPIVEQSFQQTYGNCVMCIRYCCIQNFIWEYFTRKKRFLFVQKVKVNV